MCASALRSAGSARDLVPRRHCYYSALRLPAPIVAALRFPSRGVYPGVGCGFDSIPRRGIPPAGASRSWCAGPRVSALVVQGGRQGIPVHRAIHLITRQRHTPRQVRRTLTVSRASPWPSGYTAPWAPEIAVSGPTQTTGSISAYLHIPAHVTVSVARLGFRPARLTPGPGGIFTRWTALQDFGPLPHGLPS